MDGHRGGLPVSESSKQQAYRLERAALWMGTGEGCLSVNHPSRSGYGPVTLKGLGSIKPLKGHGQIYIYIHIYMGVNPLSMEINILPGYIYQYIFSKKGQIPGTCSCIVRSIQYMIINV